MVRKDIGELIIQKGEVKKANSALVRLTGYSQTELLSWDAGSLDGFIHPEDIHLIRESMVNKAHQKELLCRCYCRLLTKDRGIKWVSIISQTVKFRQAPAESFLIIDVDWQKPHENKLLLSEIKYRGLFNAARLASIGEFAAGTAHEINNPINGIMNYAQLIQDMGGLTGKPLHYLQRIMEEGERIAATTQNLLKFAHPEMGTRVSASIAKTIQNAFELFSKSFANDGIRTSIDLTEHLPAIHCQPQLIQQVFVNILSNARYALNEKYPEADPHKKLVIGADTAVAGNIRMIQVTFLDWGIGIPQKNRDQVGTLFFTTKPPEKGMGLGLSVSYSIIEDHGGRILIDSQEGEHTKVVVELPITEKGPSKQDKVGQFDVRSPALFTT